MELVGKKVLVIEGEHKGKEGVIQEETGYTEGYGVVAKIKFGDNEVVELSHDFWEFTDFEAWLEENKEKLLQQYRKENFVEEVEDEEILESDDFRNWAKAEHEELISKVKKEAEAERQRAEFYGEISGEAFRHFIECARILVDEAVISIDNDGLELKAIDGAHVSLIRYKLHKIYFECYECKKAGKIAVNLNKLATILKIAGKDTVKIAVDNKLSITVGNITRHIALLDLTEFSDVKIPSLELDTRVALSPENVKKLKEFVSLADTITTHVIMETTGDGFTITAEEDVDSLTLSFSRNELMEHEGEAKAMYPIDYLLDIVKRLAELKSYITIEYKTNHPLKIGTDDIYYMLAPRIESE